MSIADAGNSITIGLTILTAWACWKLVIWIGEGDREERKKIIFIDQGKD